MSENLDQLLEVFTELVQSLIMLTKVHHSKSPENWRNLGKDQERDVSDLALKAVDNLKTCLDYLIMNASNLRHL